jgi:hypothetical protein
MFVKKLHLHSSSGVREVVLGTLLIWTLQYCISPMASEKSPVFFTIHLIRSDLHLVY